VGAAPGGAKKKRLFVLDGANAELIRDLPDGDPFKQAHAPVLEEIRDLAWLAYRCRVVNRAFGTALTPDQVLAGFPDETIDILADLIEHDQIADSTTMIRLFLKGAARG
jgi:hypothetical protein